MLNGGCHCGAVTFEISAPVEKVMECNCSICSKRGYLLAFVPEAMFHLTQGQDALSDYQFGKKHIHHVFCKHCGVASFGKGTAPNGAMMYAVNARCLNEFDLKSVPVQFYNGKDT